MQVPGLRIPPTKGCRPFGRPEISPAHTCKKILKYWGEGVKLFLYQFAIQTLWTSMVGVEEWFGGAKRFWQAEHERGL